MSIAWPVPLILPSIETDSPLESAMNLVAVVPAYNEQDSIASVVRELQAAVPDATVLIVDDGSDDSTAKVAHDSGALVVRLPVNVGIGAAVQAGYLWALSRGFTMILRVDADGQHDPRWAPDLIRAVEDGADVAIGSRFLSSGPNHQPPALRRIGIAIFSSIVTLLARQRITDPTSGFRCMSRRAAEFAAAAQPFDFPEVEGIVHFARAGFEITEVPVVMRDRRHGHSTIRRGRAVYYALKVLIALFILSTYPREKER